MSITFFTNYLQQKIMNKLPNIKLKKGFYFGKPILIIDFPKDDDGIKQLVKKIPERKWCDEGQFLYAPNNKDILKEIFKLFKGIAWIDTEAIFKEKSFAQMKKEEFEQSRGIVPPEYIQVLEERRYSVNTKFTYSSLFSAFIGHFNNRDLKEITKKEIEDYVYLLIRKKRTFPIAHKIKLLTRLNFITKRYSDMIVKST